MTKTIEEMRKEFENVSGKWDIASSVRPLVLEHWLGVISQRDKELREKIENMYPTQCKSEHKVFTKYCDDCKDRSAKYNILDKILSLIPTHNKE